MEHDKYKELMRSMEKKKAPQDFREQLDMRLAKGKGTWFPMPLKIATAAATLVLMLVVYQNLKPEEKEVLKPKAGFEKMETVEKKPAAPKVAEKAEEKARRRAAIAPKPTPEKLAAPAVPKSIFREELAAEIAMDDDLSSVMGAGAKLSIITSLEATSEAEVK